MADRKARQPASKTSTKTAKPGIELDDEPINPPAKPGPKNAVAAKSSFSLSDTRSPATEYDEGDDEESDSEEYEESEFDEGDDSESDDEDGYVDDADDDPHHGHTAAALRGGKQAAATPVVRAKSGVVPPKMSAADRLSMHAAAAFSDDEEFDVEADVRRLNNPHLERLPSVPPLGKGGRALPDVFNDRELHVGQESSPKLWEEAARFPNATQFRVWMMDNGNPVSIGPIDAEASEDDFIRHFYDAMPKPGEGRRAFKLRAVDINGRELGEQFTKLISEHHATLKRIRDSKKQEEAPTPMFPPNFGGPAGDRGDVIVNSGDNGSSALVEEMGRLFEDTMSLTNDRASQLEAALEEERRRVREEDKQRAEERVSMAREQVALVEKMTERLMQSDRARAEETIKSQRDQGSLLLSTLTTVFQQQQEATRSQAERLRHEDERRMQSEREAFERRQREEAERRKEEREYEALKREREREELEARRRAERDDYERRMADEAKRAEERMRMTEAQLNLQMETIKASLERERESARQQAEREKEEARMRLEREREAMLLERERLKLEAEATRLRLEAERAAAREEAERREKREAERMQREREDYDRRMQREREEAREREDRRREEMRREEEERRARAEREERRRSDELAMQLKQMEISATRDREHSERMLEMARQEREAQREAQLQREKAEAANRELQEAERRRQHEMAMREIELNRERDREHAERMLQLSKQQQVGGLGALGGITEVLGMEPAEVLGAIFGGKGGDSDSGSSWSDTIAKGIGALAEVAKVAAQAAPQARQQPQQVPMVPAPMGAVDPRLYGAVGQPIGDPRALQRPPAPLPAPQPAPTDVAQPLPPAPADDATSADNEANDDGEGEDIHPYDEARQVNTMRRAKDAGMTAVNINKSRKAVKGLAKKLKAAPEADWEGVVMAALMDEPLVYEYINNVTVYAALAETDVGVEFADRVVAKLKESAVVPADLPFTEADFFEKTQGGEA
jgi:hypothetical protein